MTRTTFALAAATAVMLTGSAFAKPEQVATYRDWIVYKAPVGEDTICYAVTQPTNMEPSTVNHGDIFFMVSTWKSGVAHDQPSFMAGYPLREKPMPLVRIGSDKWEMFSSGREGFVEAATDEERLIRAMKRGSEMRLSAMSQRGTQTEYSFSLLGISNALERAEKACK